jgi:hypothetical protein
LNDNRRQPCSGNNDCRRWLGLVAGYLGTSAQGWIIGTAGGAGLQMSIRDACASRPLAWWARLGSRWRCWQGGLVDRQQDDLQAVADRAHFQGDIGARLQIGVCGDADLAAIGGDGDQPILVATLNGPAQDRTALERREIARRIWDGGGDRLGADRTRRPGQSGSDEA